MTFLRDQMKEFIIKMKKSRKTNFYLTQWSMESSWGSTTKMRMFMRALKDLNFFRMKNEW